MKCSNCQGEAITGFKRCAHCKEICRLSAKKFRQNNLEHCKKRNNRWAQAKYKELRDAVHEKLGRICARCGFSDSRALQIDHVNGGGVKEHNSTSATVFLKKVLADTHGDYQLLCANCNWIKRAERGEHPHRT